MAGKVHPCLDHAFCGCYNSRCCLDCPTPVCLIHHPGGTRAHHARLLARTARRLRAGGATVDEVAFVIGRTRRSVFRLCRCFT